MDELKQLKAEEKRYFDTYRQRMSNEAKAKHLEEMASIIRRIDEIEKKRAAKGGKLTTKGK